MNSDVMSAPAIRLHHAFGNGQGNALTPVGGGKSSSNPSAQQLTEPVRSMLLVGSIPAAGAEEAMTVAMREIGPCLRYLPDGETGERDPELLTRRGNWCNTVRSIWRALRQTSAKR